jgi:hypothetical protein
MNKVTHKLLVQSALASTLMMPSFGGDMPATADLGSVPSNESSGDWCSALKSAGSVYKNDDNPWIQKVKIFGRYHQQWAYSDGTAAGQDFSDYSSEARRLRLGVSVDLLDRWTLLGRINFENGNVYANTIRHENFDEVFLQYRADDIGFLKNPTIGYGLTKLKFGGEWYQSSKKIKTIERSNLSNFYTPDRATGFFMGAEAGNFDLTFGVYSTSAQGYATTSWDGGEAYFATFKTEALDGTIRGDILYLDTEGNEDEIFDFDWATSLTYETQIGDWDLFTNATYGSTKSGDVYGIVIMPSRFIIEDRLELVFRYQWAHSTGLNLRPGTSSHTSVRETAIHEGVTIARGDDNHTLYAGLNYFLCDHNLKLMTGIEHETITGGGSDLDATTAWSAMRFYF